MNVIEALNLTGFNSSEQKIHKIFESKSFYIFTFVPLDFDGDPRNLPLEPSTSVDKETGEIGWFNPMTADRDELNSLSEIKQAESLTRRPE